MEEDLKLFCENLESEKNTLDKIFENRQRGILNESDFQKALRKTTRFLTDKKEVIWQEKQKLENIISTESGRFFKCLNDTFILYYEAYDTAYQSSLHNTPEKMTVSYHKARESYLLLIEAAHFIEGYREYHRAKLCFTDLKKIIDSERLLNLPTLQLTEFLFRQVDEFWSKSVYREGQIVLQICQSRLFDLRRKTSEAGGSCEELENRLEKIYELGARAENFISEKKNVDFKELTAVRNLVKKGLFVVAERLTSDLENLFTQCRIFFQKYDSYQDFLKEGDSPAIADDEIRLLISSAGWEFAANRLSEATLKIYLQKLTHLNLQVSVTNRKIAEKIKPET